MESSVGPWPGREPHRMYMYTGAERIVFSWVSGFPRCPKRWQAHGPENSVTVTRGAGSSSALPTPGHRAHQRGVRVISLLRGLVSPPAFPNRRGSWSLDSPALLLFCWLGVDLASAYLFEAWRDLSLSPFIRGASNYWASTMCQTQSLPLGTQP